MSWVFDWYVFNWILFSWLILNDSWLWYRYISMFYKFDVLKFFRYIYTCCDMSISLIMNDINMLIAWSWLLYDQCFICLNCMILISLNWVCISPLFLNVWLMIYGWNAWCNCVLCLFDWVIFMHKLRGSILSLIILKLEVYTLKIIFAQFSLKMWIFVFASF